MNGYSLRNTPHYLMWKELPEEKRFERLVRSRRKMTYTIKMIAYRAGTAMVRLLLDEQTYSAATRIFLQTLFQTPGDIIPETENKLLRIRLHRSARAADDRRIQRLCEQLNATKTTYPGTDMVMVYELIEGACHFRWSFGRSRFRCSGSC